MKLSIQLIAICLCACLISKVFTQGKDPKGFQRTPKH